MATAYEHRQTTQDLYRLFSNEPYDPKMSWVLSNEFVLDPVLQVTPKTEPLVKIQIEHKEFIPDYIVEDKPFILSGPEFNSINKK